MIEEVLFVLLGLLVAFNVGHLLTLRRCEGALLALTLESKALTNFDPSSIVDEIRADVEGLVADLLGGMRPPTIADHLGGVLAQFAQVRLMRSIQNDPALQTLMGGDEALD